MPGPTSNLKAAFALGLDSPLSAQQTFADRVSELAAFDASITNLTRTLIHSTVSPVNDFAAPRNNVLVYYGLGGVGKTTLSKELEKRFADEDARKSRATIRFDYSHATNLDLESYVIRLRAGVAELERRWPAFDLAFSLYWSRAHPGEPLREFLDRDSVLSRTAQAAGLSEAISESVNSILGAAGLPGLAGTVQRTGAALYAKARDAISRHQVLSQCQLLNSFVDANADNDTLSYLPYLLSWDLQKARPNDVTTAVFLDTYETLTAQSSRDLERWLQRSIFLMPNVLFVVTGRNRVDWAELERPVVDYIGRDHWPFLHQSNRTSEPRQHLVGNLSDEDAEQYLATVLTYASAMSPAIPDSIRRRIISGARGLPLYLDLAVTKYLDLLSRNIQPQDDDFGYPLSEVIARTLRDLDPQERRLFRTAALVTSFDLEILRAAWPQTPDAVLARFHRRPFLSVNQEALESYSLHVTLRGTIIDVDHELDDAWSARERAAVATRVADHLSGRAQTALDHGNRSEAVMAFARAAELAKPSGKLHNWIVDVAKQLLDLGSWSALVQTGSTGENVYTRPLFLWLEGESLRRSGNLSEALERHARAAVAVSALEEAATSSKLTRLLALHRAHALRVSGSYSEALQVYQELSGTEDSVSAEARYWESDFAYLSGRFSDALELLDAVDEQAATHLSGEVLRLRGHIHRVNGLFEEAEAFYVRALRLADSQGSAAAKGKALTDLVQVLSWCRPQEGLELWEQAHDVNAEIGNHIEIAKVKVARAVCLARIGQFDEALLAASDGRELSRSYDFKGGVVWSLVAEALCMVLRSDDDGFNGAVTRLREATEELTGNKFWLEIVLWWSPNEFRTADVYFQDGTSTQWLGSAEAAARRWRSVITGDGTQ